MTGREVSNPGDEEKDVREFRTAAQVRKIATKDVA